MAQHVAQRALERGGVLTDLALVDHRAPVLVQELDRVLDRDDVLACVELIWSIIAASVDDLPEPVVPVRRMILRSSSAISEITFGRPSWSIVLISCGTARKTSELTPRCWKALTRKGQAGHAEGEVDLVLLGELRELVLVREQAGQHALGVLRDSGCVPGTGSSEPCRRMSGGAGTLRWRSEPSLSMTRRRAASRSNIWPWYRLSSAALEGCLVPGTNV